MIEGFTGLMGSGKTYYVTKLALKAIKEGRSVFSNYSIIGARKWKNLAEIVRIRHDEEKGIINPIVIIDEINLVCPSRQWENLPMEVLYYWAQSRKLGIDIWWTSQHISRVDKAMREITTWVWHFKRVSFLGFSMHRGAMYLPEQVIHASQAGGTVEKGIMAPYNKTFPFTPRKRVYSQYDTMELVELPDHIVKSLGQKAQNLILNPLELPMVSELPKRDENRRETAKYKNWIALRERAGLGFQDRGNME